MPVTNEGAAPFVADGVSAFERAYASSSERREHWLRLGGRTVRLRVAGAELARRLTPALVHLETPPGGPTDLSVNCWDRTATGVPPPAPPASNEDFLPRGRMRGYVHHRVRITYDRWMRMICAYDRDRGEAWVHVADADLLPPWLDRAPLREVLTWWASDADLVLLHASAVASGGGAVALAGASGAGKSTTAMACFAAGMGFLGDDACLVRLDPDPVAHSVYGFAKLEPDAVERLPVLATLPQRCRNGQTVIEPGEGICREAALRAVVLTRVGSSRTSDVRTVAPAAALRELVASSLLEGGGASGGALPTLTRLVQRVPCLRLELGSDLDDVAARVRAIAEAA